jgi:hypothetical protein
MAVKLDLKEFLRNEVWDILKDITAGQFIERYPHLCQELKSRDFKLQDEAKLKKFLTNQKDIIKSNNKLVKIKPQLNYPRKMKTIKKEEIKEEEGIKEEENKEIKEIEEIQSTEIEVFHNQNNEIENPLKEEIKQYFINKFNKDYREEKSKELTEELMKKYNKSIDISIKNEYNKHFIIFEIENDELNSKYRNTILNAKQSKINQDNIFLNIVGNKHFYLSQEINNIEKEIADKRANNENKEYIDPDYKMNKILSLVKQTGGKEIKELCENYMLENKILVNIINQHFYEAKNKHILEDLKTKAKLQETQTNRIQQDITLKENDNIKEVTPDDNSDLLQHLSEEDKKQVLESVIEKLS